MTAAEAYTIIKEALNSSDFPQRYDTTISSWSAGVALLRGKNNWDLILQNVSKNPVLVFRNEGTQNYKALDVLKALYVYYSLSQEGESDFSPKKHWNLRLFRTPVTPFPEPLNDRTEIEEATQSVIIPCAEKLIGDSSPEWRELHKAIDRSETLNRLQDIEDEAIRQKVAHDLVKWYLAHTNGAAITKDTVIDEDTIQSTLEQMMSDKELSAKELHLSYKDDWAKKFKTWLPQHGVTASNSNYCSFLNNLSANNDKGINVFSLRTPEEVEVFRDSLEFDNKYNKWKQENSGLARNCISALNKYAAFLNDTGADSAAPAENEEKAPDIATSDNPLKAPFYPFNTIIFGAPGTGKSFKVDKESRASFPEKNIIRVTFHPEYSYFDFVGSYKPVMESDKIKYRFIPGPFARILRKAQEQPKERFCLIIEEINRARVAAVFGDIFQLLDRNSQGVSDYNIIPSLELAAYLKNLKEITEEAVTPISLPNNLYLWATMNSADQGVYPMDTAFKRRWHFEYLSVQTDAPNEGKQDTWNTVREGINKLLVSLNVNEDKQMGYYFLKKQERNDLEKAMKDKVLMYLFEDAAKALRGKFFKTGDQYKTYSGLCEKLDMNKNDLGIFQQNVIGKKAEQTKDDHEGGDDNKEPDTQETE